jgi:hypothetical protein
MIRLSALLGLPMMLTLAACAAAGQPAGPVNSPDHRWEAFQQRATVVAQAWRTGPGRQAWRSGFVPLQDQTVLPGDPKFNNETKLAFVAGWYRSLVELPTAVPADGVIRFPDGTLSVPLISAAEAYRQVDQGDPPPCSDPPVPPPGSTSSPDGAVSSGPVTACVALTVTAVNLDTTAVRTSRGEARVPA